MPLCNDIKNKHSLTFLDYSYDSISFKKEYFYNSLYLNKTGAEIFTRQLAHDLKTRGFSP